MNITIKDLTKAISDINNSTKYNSRFSSFDFFGIYSVMLANKAKIIKFKSEGNRFYISLESKFLYDSDPDDYILFNSNFLLEPK